MKKIIYISLIWSLLLPLLALGIEAEPSSTVAILGAFDEEIRLLEAQLENSQTHTIEQLRFVTGLLNAQNVVIASTGIGKVNAAMTATLTIEHFRPSQVIFTGVAGGLNPDLHLGDIVIAQRTAQHDLGKLASSEIENFGVRNPITGKRNPVFFPADPRLLKIAETAQAHVELNAFDTPGGQRHPRIVTGTVVTGDIFVAFDPKRTALHQNLDADAVEMEGAAVAQICWQHNIPCLVIRSLSDNAGSDATEDFKKYYKIAARNSAALVTQIVDELRASESLPWESEQDEKLTANEQKFQEMLSNVTLVGHFTVAGQEDQRALHEEKYTIEKVSKMSGNHWLFTARVQYAGRDVTVPLPLEVKWADDTPIITLTDMELPQLGTYTARVLMYRGQYAGTWSSEKHGGHLFGKIISNTE